MSSPQEEVARELSLQLVEEMVPAEALLFEEFWKERGNPGGTGRVRQRQDPLGFGVGDAMSIITPAIIHATLAAIEIVWNEAKVALGGAANDYFSDLRTRLKNSRQARSKSNVASVRGESPAARGLPPDLLRKLQKLAASVAIKEGVDAKTAETLSIKLVGMLALQQ